MRRAIGFLARHPALTYLLMGLAFALFGLASVDLFFVLRANLRLWIEYGTMVAGDGALRQLFEVVGMALVCAAFYVMFALCERILVKRMVATWIASRGK